MGEQSKADLFKLVDILSKQKKRNLRDVNKQRISENVRVSLIEDLSLEQYLIAKAEKCQQDHETCSTCCSMVEAGKVVLENKIVRLTYLWSKCFTGIAYESDKAQRRLLQMPLAALNVQGRIYIVEKDYHDSSSYNCFIRLLLSNSEHLMNTNNQTSRDEYETLLQHVA